MDVDIKDIKPKLKQPTPNHQINGNGVEHASAPNGAEVDQPPADGADDEDAGEVQVQSAAERGLTVETWQDRAVSKNSASGQLDQISKEFAPLLEKIEFALEALRESAVALSEAGLLEDESNFDDLNSKALELVDEAALVRLRKGVLQDITSTLAASGSMMDIQGRFRDECKKKEQEYLAKTPRQRYPRSKAYVQFREEVWESRYGSDKAMPPVATFFPAAEGEESDEGSDDEIQAGGFVQTYKDPISLTMLEDPYTSTVCPHSYSHAVIIEYLAGEHKVCPVSGCNKFISPRTIQADPTLKRKVAADVRRREREQAARAADEEIEELDDE